MRKMFLCLAIGLLSTTFAVAQASSSSTPAQQPSTAQSGQSAGQPSQSAQPSDQGSAQSAKPSDQSAQSDRDADAAARAKTDQSAQPADPNAANQNSQRAGTRNGGGVPWGWIVLGIVVVAIILGLIGRGSDRSERVETIRDRDVVRDRRDDDIRRAG